MRKKITTKRLLVLVISLFIICSMTFTGCGKLTLEDYVSSNAKYETIVKEYLTTGDDDVQVDIKGNEILWTYNVGIYVKTLSSSDRSAFVSQIENIFDDSEKLVEYIEDELGFSGVKLTMKITSSDGVTLFNKSFTNSSSGSTEQVSTTTYGGSSLKAVDIIILTLIIVLAVLGAFMLIRKNKNRIRIIRKK